MKKIATAVRVGSLLGCFVSSNGPVQAEGFTGQYLTTGNLSTQSRLLPSINNRLTGNFAPGWTKGSFDFRLEQYVENSYHGEGNAIVREHKSEEQVNYSYPLTEHLSGKLGLLHHANTTFRDNYYWVLAGLGWTSDIAPNTTFTASVLAEKRNAGGRFFYDLSGNVERRFAEKYGAFVAAHIYENFGEFDVAPTHKREFETGINYYPNKRYFAGLSYFYHRQIGDPTDRFSMVKVKFGVKF